jgi:hypothetical protein
MSDLILRNPLYSRPRSASVMESKEVPSMTIKIIPTTDPAGKVADAELHFTAGPLEGLKLIGFAVWERKTGKGRNVTFPARQYSVNGERRSYALLRPAGPTAAQDPLRNLILDAYASFEAESK